jgi:hypothetical protein
MLMSVDQILKFATDPGVKGSVFRDSHKAPLAIQFRKLRTRLAFVRFPQIHSAHHNNKLYSFLIFRKISCCNGPDH